MAGIENLIEELLLKKGEVDSGVRWTSGLFTAFRSDDYECFLKSSIATTSKFFFKA